MGHPVDEAGDLVASYSTAEMMVDVVVIYLVVLPLFAVPGTFSTVYSM